jgi:hypothetical protein
MQGLHTTTLSKLAVSSSHLSSQLTLVCDSLQDKDRRRSCASHLFKDWRRAAGASISGCAHPLQSKVRHVSDSFVLCRMQ